MVGIPHPISYYCGAFVVGHHTIYAGTEVEWNRRMAREMGHSAYRIVWHPLWKRFAVYRRTTSDDAMRLRRPLPPWTLRFACEDEQKRPCRVDGRLLDFVRDDDLMWRAPWRWMRLHAEAEAAERARDNAAYETAVDDRTREAEEHVHIATGRRGWHGYGSTGDGWAHPRNVPRQAAPAVFTAEGSRTVISARPGA